MPGQQWVTPSTEVLNNQHDLQDGQPSLRAILRDAVLVTAGAVSLVVDSVEYALRGDEVTKRQDAHPSTALDKLFGGAAVTVRLGGRGISAVPPAMKTISRPVTPLVPSRLRSAIQTSSFPDELTDLGRHERQVAEHAAARLARHLIATILPLVLDQVDLTQLVKDRVDLNDVIKSVDLDAAVGLVDLDEIVDRFPLDRVVDRLDLDAIVAGVDLDRAVSLVNLDAVAARIDIDAVLDRVDLVGIAGDIIAELNIPEMVRVSSGSLATGLVHDTRLQSMDADAAVNRVVDRFLLRRRRHAVPVPPPRPAEDETTEDASAGDESAPAAESLETAVATAPLNSTRKL